MVHSVELELTVCMDIEIGSDLFEGIIQEEDWDK
jgi:hypothetical protein